MKSSAGTSPEASSDIIPADHCTDSVNALTCCRACGELIIIISDSWDFSIKKATNQSSVSKWKRPIDFIKSRRLFEYFISNDEWNFKGIYNELQKTCKQSHYKSPFPLCNSCCSILLQRIRSRIQFYEESKHIFMRLDIKEKDAFKKELLLKISNNTNETSAFSEAKIAYKEEADKIEKFGRKRNKESNVSVCTRKINEIIERSSVLQDSYFNMDVKSPPQTFSSLTLGVVFHIGVNRFFGTINCARIGQTNAWSVSYDEINTGLVFMAQLIKSLCRICSFDSSAIRYGLTMFINNEELNANDTKSRRLLRKFNSALLALFDFCDRFFESDFIRSNFLTPPISIEMEKQTIGNISFLFDYGNPSNWTNAMKLLLLDFKSIQAKALHEASQPLTDL